MTDKDQAVLVLNLFKHNIICSHRRLFLFLFGIINSFDVNACVVRLALKSIE